MFDKIFVRISLPFGNKIANLTRNPNIICNGNIEPGWKPSLYNPILNQRLINLDNICHIGLVIII
jgi:hypothetical protein